MLEDISEPREDYKDHAPRIVSLTVPGEAIGPIIGPGGKIIQRDPRHHRCQRLHRGCDGKGIVEICGDEQVGRSMPPLLRSRPSPSHQPWRWANTKDRLRHHAIRRVCRGHSWTGRSASRERTGLQARERVEDVLKEGDIVKFKVVDRTRSGKIKLSSSCCRKVLPRTPTW